MVEFVRQPHWEKVNLAKGRTFQATHGSISYLSIDGLVKVSQCMIQKNAAIQVEIIFETRSQNYTGHEK